MDEGSPWNLIGIDFAVKTNMSNEYKDTCHSEPTSGSSSTF